MNSDDSSIVVQSTVETTSTVTNETITSTLAVASTKSVAVTTQSTISSNTTSTTTVSRSSPEIDSKTADPVASNDPLWKSRPLERQGSGCNDGYFIDDRSEININFQKYRMVFVVNKDAVFYKKNAFRQAKLVSTVRNLQTLIDLSILITSNFLLSSIQSHAAVTKSMSSKFYRFVTKWCDKNVTETMRNQCNDWFMGRHPDLVSNVTLKIEGNDVTKTPYAPYNRYKLDRTNTKS